MARTDMIQINNVDKFNEILKTFGGCKPEKVIAAEMGFSDTYITQVRKRKSITRSGLQAFATYFGVDRQKMIDAISGPKEEPKEEPKKEQAEPKGDDVLNMLTLIYEMEKRQTEQLQKLTMMFERTWCH